MIVETGASLFSAIAERGYAFVEGHEVRNLLTTSLRGPLPAGPQSLSDWDAFAASWNDLGADRFMADGGRYRRRRHAVYAATIDGRITRGPRQPHYQSRDYNPLNGGIARWFDPIDDAVGGGATMTAILAFTRGLFEGLAGAHAWHVEAHQFRIEARRFEKGLPTPEGVHRDGVDYVLVLLVSRQNIVSGTTTIHRLDGQEIGSFTLTVPLDAALLDDARVAHGVTPIEPHDSAAPGHRDVLVVTWRRLRAE